MNMRQMELLMAVLEWGGYRKAAERLHVSHSAIHRQIRMLQDEFEDELITRWGHTFRPTPAGDLLVQLARRFFSDRKNTVLQIRDLAQREGGCLRIGTGPTVLLFFLMPILQTFQKDFPKARIYVMCGETVPRDLEAGSLDLAVYFEHPDFEKSDILSWEKLYTEEFVFAVSHRHPLAGRRSVNIQELEQFSFILPTKGSDLRLQLDRFFQDVRFSPAELMEVDSQEAAEKALAAMEGIAYLNKARASSHHIAYLRLQDLKPTCNVGILLRKSTYLHPFAQEFTNYCKAALNKNGVATISSRQSSFKTKKSI